MKKKAVVIPKEKATFWMDGRGRWHNQHGPFENKKIIDYFNSAIQLDLNGYYVTQERDGITEKVYFIYEDTAVFVVDVVLGNNPTLVLNTRAIIPFLPDELFICKDQLYILCAGERIKFSERALLKVADQIAFEKGHYFFGNINQRHLIPSGTAQKFVAKDKS